MGIRLTKLCIVPILLLSCACIFIEPPRKILNSFQFNFPEARNSNWKQEGTDWNVNYKVHGLAYTTYMDTYGMPTRTECQTNYIALPMPVRKSFETRYDMKEITDIMKVDNREEIYFEFFMLTDNKKYKLTYSSNGYLTGGLAL